MFISACKFIGLLNEDNKQWENYKKNKAKAQQRRQENKPKKNA